MLNSVGDINTVEIRKSGELKQITGEDTIRAPVKLSNKSLSFRSYAKLVYSCNDLPATTDKGRAFYNRSRVIRFPFVFEGENEDKNLLEKITTPQELSGLFNKAIVSLKDLLENSKFTGELPFEEKKHIWEEASNPVYRFINECCERDTSGYVSKQRLRGLYVDWAEKNDAPILEEKSFKTTLLRTFPYVIDAKKGKVGESKNSWTGIKLKEEYKETIQTFSDTTEDIK